MTTIKPIKTINKAKDMNSCVADSSEPPVPARRRILVADDDEGIRRLISAVLARAGFDVNTASDGQQAWEALLHEPYDLLVTDNEMPRLAGVELIARIRDAGMSLPVIVASGTFYRGESARRSSTPDRSGAPQALWHLGSPELRETCLPVSCEDAPRTTSRMAFRLSQEVPSPAHRSRSRWSTPRPRRRLTNAY